MKKTILIAFLCVQIIQGFAQKSNYQWPIKGSQSGENILCKPQSYIENELNFGNLYIGAKQGDTLISPTDGIVIRYGYGYKNSLTTSYSFKISIKDYDSDSKEIFANWDTKFGKKYLNIRISIKTKNGKTIHIEGLQSIKSFKTGEKITKGEFIGTIGFVYHKITKPCMSLSISINVKHSDPMVPFGLKTTFIPYKPAPKKNILSVNEMQDDLSLFVDALKEGYPGLYDYISEEKFDSLIKHSFVSISKPLTLFQFEILIKNIIGQIHDSHLLVLSKPSVSNYGKPFFPSVNMGWLKDSLIINRTIPKYQHLYGKRIVEVDGISADSLKQMVENYSLLSNQHSDGFVKSINKFRLLTTANLSYFNYYSKASKTYDLNLRFSDGKNIQIPGSKRNPKTRINFIPDWSKFFTTNFNKTGNFLTKKLANNTAYLSLSNFNLNEIEIAQVSQFIKSIADSSYQHLIIDVRNNSGGEEEMVSQIFSLIAKQPFQTISYKKVNKTNSFDLFEHTLNYRSIIGMYKNFTSVAGKSGYYLYPKDQIEPDSTCNFRGRVYVLANERSFSAATLFPALVHKYKRGAVVGRETPTTYYQMNANDYANLQLSNSLITVRIPLVQIVFDTVLNAKIPWGRGVIPDYPVHLSLDEMVFKNGDSILNYTQELIAQSKYIPSETYNDSSSNKEERVKNNLYLYTLFGTLLLGVFLIIIFRTNFSKVKKSNNRRKLKSTK